MAVYDDDEDEDAMAFNGRARERIPVEEGVVMRT